MKNFVDWHWEWHNHKVFAFCHNIFIMVPMLTIEFFDFILFTKINNEGGVWWYSFN